MMEAKPQVLEKVVKLLERVLSGDIQPTEALDQWPDVTSGVIEESRHILDHYASDADIRRKNPEYEKQQRKLIEACLSRLKSNYR